MERIICDSYVKGEMKLWDIDVDSSDTQKFNRKITAVNDMFGWLYEKGILEKISFEFKDYSDITYFAFDTKDLQPFRKEMEASGLQDAELAVQHIFDVKYSPCLYSGAIELTWPMFSYRDIDGTVSRSWECGLCKHLNTNGIFDVEQIREEKGVKEAVKYAFEISGFEPSDVVKVRALTEEDREQVEALDKESGNDVAWGIDSEEYAWGVFIGRELIGYCTLGGAEEYDEYDEYKFGDLCLSDVYIKEKFRGKSLASMLIDNVFSQCVTQDEKVFITILDDNLAEFYEKFGFRTLGAGNMVRDNSPGLDEVIKSASNKVNVPLVDKNKENNYRDDR